MGLFYLVGQFSHGQEWAHSLQRHARFYMSLLMSNNGPIHHPWLSYRQQWAHSMASATFLMCSNWPIQSHQQLFPWKIMGPFIIISNISLDQQWVHSLSSGVFLMGNNGPNSMSLATFLMASDWPILSYWQLFPWAIMGPFIVIGNISFNQ